VNEGERVTLTAGEVAEILADPNHEPRGAFRIYAELPGHTEERPNLATVKSSYYLDRYSGEAVRFVGIYRTGVPIRRA